VFTDSGVHVIKTPVRAPRANAIAEQFFASVRRELLDRILILNTRRGAMVPAQHEQHFNTHRPHRGLGQAEPPRRLPDAPVDHDVPVIRRHRLGGLLYEYAQVA
jgi:putative transposase